MTHSDALIFPVRGFFGLTMSVLLQRARESGKCPPSLISETAVQGDGLEEAMQKVLDVNGKKQTIFLVYLRVSFQASNLYCSVFLVSRSPSFG